MISRTNRPHFVRSTANKQKTLSQDQKLLCLLVRRISNGLILSSFKKLKEYSHHYVQKLIKLQAHMTRNAELSQLLAWKKLKTFIQIKRKNQHLLKFIAIASANCIRFNTQTAFRAIQNKIARRSNACTQKFLSMRASIASNTLNRISRKQMRLAFSKIHRSSQRQQAKKKKIKTIALLLAKLVEKNKIRAWSKISNVSSGEQKDFQQELSQLNKQVDLVRKQLSQKKKEVQDLQNQISAHSRNGTQRSLRDSKSLDHRRSYTALKKMNTQEREEKKSEGGSHDNSILSWLNNSFFTLRSGRSSRSISAAECFCKYRQKYNHYKCEAISLKNQLDIIKNELEVTKDLNEHLQDQIANFFDAENSSQEMDRLRRQVKEMRRQRDSMKEKIVKYQKYIANLKVEFKAKIQNLYRSLKKSSI